MKSGQVCSKNLLVSLALNIQFSCDRSSCRWGWSGGWRSELPRLRSWRGWWRSGSWSPAWSQQCWRLRPPRRSPKSHSCCLEIWEELFHTICAKIDGLDLILSTQYKLLMWLMLWIAILWCRKQLLYQLSHYHYLSKLTITDDRIFCISVRKNFWNALLLNW